ncbi:hypothetical protein IWQ52_004360 [Labrenzia sp. EL_159]|nr:hypothetical protein [Labrenzia sp. EL_162]MBG6196824.1 hypothetical protein [Labrenzia sp. EL_159]
MCKNWGTQLLFDVKNFISFPAAQRKCATSYKLHREKLPLLEKERGADIKFEARIVTLR